MRNAAIAISTNIGIEHIIAKALNLAVVSSYIASENRRSNNKNLPPPNLPDVVFSAFIGIHATIWRDCFLQQSDLIGTDDIQSC